MRASSGNGGRIILQIGLNWQGGVKIESFVAFSRYVSRCAYLQVSFWSMGLALNLVYPFKIPCAYSQGVCPRWADVSGQYLNSLFRGFVISFGRDPSVSSLTMPPQFHHNNP